MKPNKNLIDLFELAHDEPIDEDLPMAIDDAELEPTENTLTSLQLLEQSLSAVTDLDNTDTELDELADLATDAFRDITDLASNVEAKHASELYQAASSFLSHAIGAKTAKINRKLKQMDLLVKKAQLDSKAPKAKDGTSTEETAGAGSVKSMDRNELLALIKSGAPINANNEQKTDK